MVVNEMLQFKVFYFRSAEFKEIVRACLNKDAFQRPSAKQLQQVHLYNKLQTVYLLLSFRPALLSGYFAICFSNISALQCTQIIPKRSFFVFRCCICLSVSVGVPWWQSHRLSGIATLPSVGTVPQSPYIGVDQGTCCVLCLLFDYCLFDFSVYYMYLQYFDTVGWVF